MKLQGTWWSLEIRMFGKWYFLARIPLVTICHYCRLGYHDSLIYELCNDYSYWGFAVMYVLLYLVILSHSWCKIHIIYLYRMKVRRYTERGKHKWLFLLCPEHQSLWNKFSLVCRDMAWEFSYWPLEQRFSTMLAMKAECRHYWEHWGSCFPLCQLWGLNAGTTNNTPTETRLSVRD